VTDEPKKTYSFKDLVGGVLTTDLKFGNEDNSREPIKVEFSYHDAEGKLWMVEALGYREPGVRISDHVTVNVDLSPQPAGPFNPDLIIGPPASVYHGPCSVCGYEQSICALYKPIDVDTSAATAWKSVSGNDAPNMSEWAPPTGAVEGAAHMIENWRNWGACKDLPIVSVPLSDLYYGPCSVCGDTTSWACSDCKIDTSVSVYVCDKGACQRAHERTHKAVQE
jgi:hypothetical protein